jgi:oligosaccharide repeat unit polymerase
MVAGYYSIWPRLIALKIKKINLIFNARPKLHFVFAIFIFGLIGQLSLFLLGYGTATIGKIDIPTYLGIIQKLAFLLPISIIFAFSIYLKSKKKIYSFYIILMVLIYLIIFFIKGWRGFLLNSVWIFILPYHYLYKRLNITKLSIVLFILLLITLVVLIPLFSNYRVQLMKSNYSIFDALKNSFEEYYTDFNSSIKFIFNRMIGLDSFMLIIEKNERLNGSTLYYSVIGLIPRFIWKNKPNLDVGRKTAVDIYNIPSDIQTSTSVMNIGDLFWNFGILGTLIGMAILGTLYRIFYLYFISKPTIGSVGAYTILFISFINIEDGIGMLTANIISSLILVLIIFILNRIIK